MAEEYDAQRMREREEELEVKERGVFDFMGKKPEEGENQDEVIAAEFEGEKDKKKHGLLEKLHRSDSGCSGSSDEEEGEENKKRKEKKLEKKNEETFKETANIAVEKYDQEAADTLPPPPAAEEKKGFLDKIKEKIPVVGGGHTKKAEEVSPPPPPQPSDCNNGEADGKEKGLLEKIKDKIPGYHPKSQENVKQKDS